MSKYSVLVVDDQENWRELLSELLEDQFVVTKAADYHSALEAIHKQSPPFHVVVTDMRLVDQEPGNEDGLELIKDLKKRTDETKTFVITGYATINSATRAYKDLDVFEYLEKWGGSSLDHRTLCKKVFTAAEEIEARRPKGFRDISQHVLLLAPDPAWQADFERMIRQSGYQVSLIQTVGENLDQQLRDLPNHYSLILINELFASQQTLDTVQNSYPNAKLIVLTTSNVGRILELMKEYPIAAFPMPNGNFDPDAFRDFLNDALSYSATKYISVQIGSGSEPKQYVNGNPALIINETYDLHMHIHDEMTPQALGVVLSPSRKKNGKVKLHVFMHANQMKVEPVTEGYWEIPLSMKHPKSFDFSITPRAAGKNTLTIEIDQDHRLLGRIPLSFDCKEVES